MKIGTQVIVNVIDIHTDEIIAETQGKACDFIVPQSGDFLEMNDKVYRVEKVGHRYSNAYRNTIIILVTDGS